MPISDAHARHRTTARSASRSVESNRLDAMSAAHLKIHRHMSNAEGFKSMNLFHIDPKYYPKFDSRLIPLFVVLVGMPFSFLAAVVPHYGSAYQLVPLAMATGVAAYGLYGVLAGMWNSPLVQRAGLWLLGAHVAATLMVRVFLGSDAARTLLILVPVLLIAGLMVLWPRAVRASRIIRPDAGS